MSDAATARGWRLASGDSPPHANAQQGPHLPIRPQGRAVGSSRGSASCLCEGSRMSPERTRRRGPGSARRSRSRTTSSVSAIAISVARSADAGRAVSARRTAGPTVVRGSLDEHPREHGHGNTLWDAMIRAESEEGTRMERRGSGSAGYVIVLVGVVTFIVGCFLPYWGPGGLRGPSRCSGCSSSPLRRS